MQNKIFRYKSLRNLKSSRCLLWLRTREYRWSFRWSINSCTNRLSFKFQHPENKRNIRDVPGERGWLESEPDVGQELRQELHGEGGQGLPHARLPLQVILASSIVMMILVSVLSDRKRTTTPTSSRRWNRWSSWFHKKIFRTWKVQKNRFSNDRVEHRKRTNDRVQEYTENYVITWNGSITSPV